MTVRYASICAGIEAASEAVKSLGWVAVAFSEIDRAASHVLAHRHPDVPNLGDFTAIDPRAVARTYGRVDVLFGGTPCQAFSVAGQRRSLDDARGNLTLAFVDLAHGLVEHCGLRNALWENVPGVLNTPDNAFGCFLSGLVGGDDSLCPPGDGRWPRAGMVAGPRARAAWRVLDAQYFGLAQRRARVWLVVDFGDGADPATVLFERQGLRRHPPARGEAGEGIAATLGASTGGCSGKDDPAGRILAYAGGNRSGDVEVAATLTARGHKCDFEVETFITHARTGEGFDAREDGTGRGTPTVPIAFDCKVGGKTGFSISDETTGTLRSETGHASVAFDLRGPEGGSQLAVRRLTQFECEKLQGFSGTHTLVPDAKGKPQADGPRYRQIGNSWPVPVAAWICARIDEILRAKAH